MIIAAQHNKLRAKRIDYVEDEYTSCVFGEIRHYPVGKIWGFFDELIKKAGINNEHYDKPHGVQFRFWPKFNKVEPDLVVDFYSDNEQNNCVVHIIVEVKWNTDLSPNCELVRQWCNRENPREQWLHLYLTKSGAKGLKGIQQTKGIIDNGCDEKCSNNNHIKEIKKFSKTQLREARGILGYITWSDIAQAADNNQFSGISNFLVKNGIGLFTGFNFICDYHSILEQSSNHHFYQNTPWWDFLKKFNLAPKGYIFFE